MTRLRTAAVLGALAAVAFAVPPLATAAPLGVNSARLGTETQASPPFHVTQVGTFDGGGTNSVGDLGRGDILFLTFSAPVRPNSVCPTFTGNFQGGYTVRVSNASPSDLLTVTGGPNGCTPRVATVSLGSTGHVTGTVNFTGSSMQDYGDTVLVVFLGNPSGRTNRITDDTVLTATPDAALRDTGNRPVSTGTASTPLGVQF